MKDFVVIFVLKPAIRIDDKFNSVDFTFNEFDGNKRVIIVPIKEQVSNQAVQTGLVFRVYVSADNINEAKENAKGFVDGVIGLLTFTTGVGLPIPNEILAYELTQNTQERDFLQIFFNPLNINLSRRTLDQDFFMRFVQQMYKQGESYHNIARALRWYRIGALTFDIFDKFSCFWMGMEALNPVIQKKVGTCNETKIVKCDTCGNEWSISNPTVSGIKSLLKDKMQNPELYQGFRSFRVNLMHSTCQLGKIEKEASELTPKLAETLFRAICFVLDFEDWKVLPYKETLENVPTRLEVQGKLIGEHSGNLGFDGKDPYLETSHNLLNLKIENEEFIFQNTSNFTPRIEPFKSFRMSEVRMYGDKGMKGSMDSIGKKDEQSGKP